MARAPQPQKTGGGGGSLYYEIANFQTGMDLRKSPLTAPAGSLQLLQNAHITSGGEIEKREAFVYWCAAPAGSIGMCAVNDQVFTHFVGGSPGTIVPPTDTDIGVIYIAAPKAAITITASIAGTAMTVTYASAALAPGMQIIGTGVAAGTVITGGSGTSGAFTVNISQTSYPSGAIGGATGATLQYQLDFDTFNGLIYAIFQGSDGQVYHYYNGVQVVQGTGKASNIRTYKEKMYGVTGRYMFFSAVGDPTVWANPSPDSGGTVELNHSGFISLGAQDADSESMVAMEVYYDKMALFSTLSCQLWFLDPDETKNQYYQTLRDAGTIAPGSVRQYVASDVYFLGNHGVRSLRARDLTLTAAVADVGSPLDPVIQDLLAIRGQQWGAWQTQTLLSPRTGRIWLTFGDRIYVLSNYASPNISAWSVYLTDGWNIDIKGAVFADPYVYVRNTNGNIYRFGSTGAQIYDSCPVEILTPYLSFDKPVTFKFYQGFDAICTVDTTQPNAQWLVEMSFDPTVTPVPFDTICTMNGPTVQEGRIPISARATHVQLRITHQAPGAATFAKLMIHYAPGDTS